MDGGASAFQVPLPRPTITSTLPSWQPALRPAVVVTAVDLRFLDSGFPRIRVFFFLALFPFSFGPLHHTRVRRLRVPTRQTSPSPWCQPCSPGVCALALGLVLALALVLTFLAVLAFLEGYP